MLSVVYDGQSGEDDGKFKTGAWEVFKTMLSVAALLQLDLRNAVRKQGKEVAKRFLLNQHTFWAAK